MCIRLKLPEGIAGMLANAGLPSQYAHLVGTIQSGKSRSVCIVVVANKDGVPYLNYGKVDALSDIDGYKPGVSLTSFNPPNQTEALPNCTPRKLRKILAAGSEAWFSTCVPQQLTETVPANNRHMNYSCTRMCGARQQPHEMVVYTDGSCLTGKDRQPQRLGGAAICYYNNKEQVIQVHPQGRGLTNTINRAEISSIHQALQAPLQEDHTPKALTIYTDSQCALSLIQNRLKGGHKHYITPHKSLLDETVQVLENLVTAGCTITMRKVKSHIGITGNERADEVAVKTAQGKRIDTATQATENIENAKAYKDMVWPCITKRTAEGKDEQEPISNLTTSVVHACQNICEQNHCGSYASVYAVAWRSAAPQIWNKAGRWLMSRKIPWAAKRSVMKYRWGRLFTTKLAKMMKMTYFGKPVDTNAQGEALCPLCRQPDSGTHVMGGCTGTPEIQALYVKRHDEAVQSIRQAISTGACGQGTILMDAGKRADLPAEVSGKASDLEQWLKIAPRSWDGPVLPRLSKPDLVILPDVPKDRVEHLLGSGGRLPMGQRIILIEVGYTSDTKPDDKRQEKWEQHSVSVETLTRLGFKVEYDRDTHCVPLGHGGTVYNSLETLLRKLGVKAGHTNKLMRQLEKHAVQYAHTIIVTRRKLEATRNHDNQTSPSSQKHWVVNSRKRKRDYG